MSRFDLPDEPQRPTQPPLHVTILARLQLESRRRHLFRWVLAALATTVLTLSVTNARSSALKARDQWGESTTVWVMTNPLDAGQLISPSDVARRDLPVGAIPDDATVLNPSGSRLRDAVAAGEVVRAGRLAIQGSGPIAARLPPATRGITLRVDNGSVLNEGDNADLIAMIGGRPVATSARVVASGDGWATFAVADYLVSGVVNELSLGGVMAVLAP